MKIEYENKVLDLVMFNFWHFFSSIRNQIVFFALVAIVFWVNIKYSHYSISYALFLAVVYYAVLWIGTILFSALIFFSKKNDGFLTKHILEIQDEALYEETKYGKMYNYWFGIERVVARPGYIFVYVSQHLSHPIPDRAFASKEEKEKFLSLLKDKLQIVK